MLVAFTASFFACSNCASAHPIDRGDITRHCYISVYFSERYELQVSECCRINGGFPVCSFYHGEMTVHLKDQDYQYIHPIYTQHLENEDYGYCIQR